LYIAVLELHAAHEVQEVGIVWVGDSVHELLLVLLIHVLLRVSLPLPLLLANRILTLLLLHILKVHSLLLWVLRPASTESSSVLLPRHIRSILSIDLLILLVVLAFILLLGIVVFILIILLALVGYVLNVGLLIVMCSVCILSSLLACNSGVKVLILSHSLLIFLRIEIILLLGFVAVRVVVLLIIFIDFLSNVDLVPHPLVSLLSSVTSLVVESVLLLLLLLAHVELVADALVVHVLKHNLRKPVVVPTDFECVGNDGLNSVVVTHDFNLTNHTLLPSTALRIHLVVVASNEQVRNRVSCPDLDLAVVTSQNETIRWLHHRHGNRVVRDVN
jgi:hypothetical protein